MATYDLSQPLESGMQTYPGDSPVVVDTRATFEDDGYRVTGLALGSHTGTHVDAPSHTEADGANLGAYDLETFRFDAHLVDVTVGDRAAITPAHLPASTDADLVVFHTGWDAHWGTPRALDHPYLTREAAEWCVEQGVHVATDALNVDPTPSPASNAGEPTGLPAHHTLLGAGRLIVENLTGLDQLPETFRLHAYPLALDADGAPVRAVGITDD